MNTSTVVKERPILFRGAMIRAILNGQKTQTIRVVKPQPLSFVASDDTIPRCPYGKPGDRLWVRETWKCVNTGDFGTEIVYKAGGDSLAIEPRKSVWGSVWERPFSKSWKPSIYMPRVASRLLLEVTGVRVERLQDISAQDAIAEGWPGETLKCCGDGCAYDGINSREIIQATGQDDDAPVLWFADLWDSINGKAGGKRWAANPWVWVVEFKSIPA